MIFWLYPSLGGIEYVRTISEVQLMCKCFMCWFLRILLKILTCFGLACERLWSCLPSPIPVSYELKELGFTFSGSPSSAICNSNFLHYVFRGRAAVHIHGPYF